MRFVARAGYRNAHRRANLNVVQLWLNEGFATWVGWLAIDHFYPGNLSSYVRDLNYANAHRMECLGSVCCKFWFLNHEITYLIGFDLGIGRFGTKSFST